MDFRPLVTLTSYGPYGFTFLFFLCAIFYKTKFFRDILNIGSIVFAVMGTIIAAYFIYKFIELRLHPIPINWERENAKGEWLFHLLGWVHVINLAPPLLLWLPKMRKSLLVKGLIALLPLIMLILTHMVVAVLNRWNAGTKTSFQEPDLSGIKLLIFVLPFQVVVFQVWLIKGLLKWVIGKMR